MSQLTKLAVPFPDKFIETKPGKFSAAYVPHGIVTQFLLGILGPYDFHIDDVVRFFCYVVENEKNIKTGKVFKLGTGTGTTLKQLATKIEIISRCKTHINWGGKKYRPNDVMHAVSDHEVSEILKPMISLEEGLKRYINE